MSVMAIGDEDLLDYVIEKDMEDTVARIILSALSVENMGQKKLASLLRGRKGHLFKDKPDLQLLYGKLSQLEEDQVLDFIESLNRLGLVCRVNRDGGYPVMGITAIGMGALNQRSDIPAQIPWPLPSTWDRYARGVVNRYRDSWNASYAADRAGELSRVGIIDEDHQFEFDEWDELPPHVQEAIMN